MNDPEKLAPYGTQDEEKQTKNKDGIILTTTTGKYSWSSAIQLFLNGESSHDGDRATCEVITSTCLVCLQ
jgi:hypothetical protein